MCARNCHSYTRLIRVLGIVREPTVSMGVYDFKTLLHNRTLAGSPQFTPVKDNVNPRLESDAFRANLSVFARGWVEVGRGPHHPSKGPLMP